MIKPSDIPGSVRAVVAMMVVTASTLVSTGVLEDWRGDAYLPVKGDKYTYGYGSTTRDDGTPVRKGDKTTPARSLVRLHWDLENVYANALKKCITAPLYVDEFQAYVMLAYSVGGPTVCRKAKPGSPPNLIDLINAGRYAEACARIEAFNKGPGGVVLPGLVNRRKAEREKCDNAAQTH